MSLVDRAKNILLSPKTEWPVIAAEPASVGSLFTGYAVILALLPVVGSILGGLVFGGALGVAGLGATFFIVPAVVGYVIGLGLLYIMGIIADALAPSFDGTKNQISALKLVVYSATPQWVAGLFAFIPGINILLSLAGFAYGAYLMYLGSTAVMKVPESKAIGYTAVVIILWIVLSFLISAVILGAIMSALIGGAMVGTATL